MKPDNILVSASGHLKLADFGLSKMHIDDNYSSNSFVGTHPYLAPEIVAKMSYGKSVDWYGVGAVLYEFCLARPPGYSESIEDLKENIQTDALELPKRMPSELKDLLMRLLSRNPL